MQKDNGTLRRKVSLRHSMLQEIDAPVVMETHGGFGRVYQECYSHVPAGIVFETDPEKSAVLAAQRPNWAVYEAHSDQALLAGIGAHLAVNVLDVDPYGDPWPTIDAFFLSERPRPQRLDVVVNDGLRQMVKRGGSFHVNTLKDTVQLFGNDLYDSYLKVCQRLMKGKASQAGYTLTRWAGYHCGYNGQMTHYWAVLLKE